MRNKQRPMCLALILLAASALACNAPTLTTTAPPAQRDGLRPGYLAVPRDAAANRNPAPAVRVAGGHRVADRRSIPIGDDPTITSSDGRAHRDAHPAAQRRSA